MVLKHNDKEQEERRDSQRSTYCGGITLVGLIKEALSNGLAARCLHSRREDRPDSSDYQQVCRSLTAELSDIEVDGDKATANLTYRYELDGQAYEGKADLTCEQSDGRWLISKLQGK